MCFIFREQRNNLLNINCKLVFQELFFFEKEEIFTTVIYSAVSSCGAILRKYKQLFSNISILYY